MSDRQLSKEVSHLGEDLVSDIAGKEGMEAPGAHCGSECINNLNSVGVGNLLRRRHINHRVMLAIDALVDTDAGEVSDLGKVGGLPCGGTREDASDCIFVEMRLGDDA